MLHQNLSRIIRLYKGRGSFEIHQKNMNFQWQPCFHSNIIKDKKAIYVIKKYIITNPAKWSNDVFFLAEQDSKGLEK